jgi:hypothetical protein
MPRVAREITWSTFAYVSDPRMVAAEFPGQLVATAGQAGL